MSLPLGHMALGVTAYDFCADGVSVFRHWRTAVFVAILANLPDVDVVVGLVLQGNGSAFHRGPAHSIAFALLMSLIAANVWRILPQAPRIGFNVCFVIILSHLLADYFFSGGHVSFFWPLAVQYSHGFKGLGDVFIAAIQVYQDLGVIMGCGAMVVCRRLVVGDLVFQWPFRKVPAFRGRRPGYRQDQ
jgi:membrane-bound metal-dependent hydrolase YbcI (DUF457 family)